MGRLASLILAPRGSICKLSTNLSPSMLSFGIRPSFSLECMLLQYSTSHSGAKYCTTLHFSALYFTALQYQCTASHFNALLHCISSLKCTEVQPAECFHLILQSASIPSFCISLLCKLDWILCLKYLSTKSYIWLDHDDVWSRSPDERDKKKTENEDFFDTISR